MKPSTLNQIIERLEIMTRQKEPSLRRFEINGIEKAQVRYNPETQIFELYDLARSGYYQFDNIDLVAIDIYELLG